MAKLGRKRRAEVMRAALLALRDGGGSLRIEEVVEAARNYLVLTGYEEGTYSAGQPRFRWIVSFSTIRAVKAGWLQKHGGVWTLTSAGALALKAFDSAEALGQEGSRLYKEWWHQRQSTGDKAPDEEETDGPDLSDAVAWDVDEHAALRITNSWRDTPRANPENLLDIVRDATLGKVVLPEFQRSFVWGKDDIEQLLGSILQNYFIGTFLVLDTASDRPMFPYRLVEGQQATNAKSPAMVRLVLDGQQRISSLFYVLNEPDLPLRNAKHPYRFFVRLDVAVQQDLDESVVGIPSNDKRGFAKMERLIKQDRALTIRDLANPAVFYKWLNEPDNKWSAEAKTAIEHLHKNILQFMVPIVSLKPETGRDNVVNIFELINRTGISLSLFDLAVARLYLKGVKLRERWLSFVSGYQGEERVLRRDFLLKIVVLLGAAPKVPKKGSILETLDDITKADFETLWESATEAMTAAMKRLRTSYGAYNPELTPYSTMLVPLACLLHEIRTRKLGAEAYRRLDSWYWSSVFSQRYESAVDTKSYTDARDVLAWILDEDDTPSWIETFELSMNDLNLAEQRSALYRGTLCLVVREGAFDFRTGQPAPLNLCHDDHIFPRGRWKQETVDSVVNRSVIEHQTNLWKSDRPPSEFVADCLAAHGGDETRLLRTFATHLIDEVCVQALRADNLDAFLDRRRTLIRSAIERAARGTSAAPRVPTNLEDVLKEQEDEALEFKSTLRMDLKTGIVNKDLERSVARTVSAFLNTNGGLLVIGVGDHGELIGIERDYESLGQRKDKDGWQQAFRNVLHAYLPKDAVALVRVEFRHFKEITAALVHVPEVKSPVYLKDSSGSHFFVRSGNTSQELEGAAVHEWLNERAG